MISRRVALLCVFTLGLLFSVSFAAHQVKDSNQHTITPKPDVSPVVEGEAAASGADAELVKPKTVARSDGPLVKPMVVKKGAIPATAGTSFFEEGDMSLFEAAFLEVDTENACSDPQSKCCGGNVCQHVGGTCCPGNKFCCPRGTVCAGAGKCGVPASPEADSIDIPSNPDTAVPGRASHSAVKVQAINGVGWNDVDFEGMSNKEREIATSAKQETDRAHLMVDDLQDKMDDIRSSITRMEAQRIDLIKSKETEKVAQLRKEVLKLKDNLITLREQHAKSIEAAEQKVKKTRALEEDNKRAAALAKKLEEKKKIDAKNAEEAKKEEGSKKDEQTQKHKAALQKALKEKAQAEKDAREADKKVADARTDERKAAAVKNKAMEAATKKVKEARSKKGEADKKHRQQIAQQQKEHAARVSQMKQAEQQRKHERASERAEKKVAEESRKKERSAEEEERKFTKKSAEADRKGSESERKANMKQSHEREMTAVKNLHSKEMAREKAASQEELAKANAEKARQATLKAKADTERVRHEATTKDAERRGKARELELARAQQDKQLAQKLQEETDKAEKKAAAAEADRRRQEEKEKVQEAAEKTAVEQKKKSDKVAEEANKERDAAERIRKEALAVRIAAEESEKKHAAAANEEATKEKQKYVRQFVTASGHAAAALRDTDLVVKDAERAQRKAEEAQLVVESKNTTATPPELAELQKKAAIAASSAVDAARKAAEKAQEAVPICENALEKAKLSEVETHIANGTVTLNKATESEQETDEFLANAKEIAAERHRLARELDDMSSSFLKKQAAEQQAKKVQEASEKKLAAEVARKLADAKAVAAEAKGRYEEKREDVDDAIEYGNKLADEAALNSTVAHLRVSAEAAKDAYVETKILQSRGREALEAANQYLEVAKENGEGNQAEGFVIEAQKAIQGAKTLYDATQKTFMERETLHKKEVERLEQEHKAAAARRLAAIPRFLETPIKSPYYPYGNGFHMPSYSFAGDKEALCVLSGAMSVSDFSEPIVPSMPSKCTPKARHVFFQHIGHSDVLRVDVFANGTMMPVDVPTGLRADQVKFIALEGIVIPNKDTTFRPVTAGPGWAVKDGFQAPGFFVDRGVCYLTGVLARGGDSGSFHVATLPADCRPKGGKVIGRFSIETDGVVKYMGEIKDKNLVSLDGVQFSIEQSLKTLALKNGWSKVSVGYRQPAYSKHGEVCVLQGVVNNAGPDMIATLPLECRPSSGRLVFHIWYQGLHERIDVLANGDLVWSGKRKGGMISLEGLAIVVAAEQEWERAKIVEVAAKQQKDEEVRLAHLREAKERLRRRAVPAGLNLLTGYEAYGEGHRVPQFSRSDTTCFISGRVRSIEQSFKGPIIRLPDSCRPAKRITFGLFTEGAKIVSVDVTADGNIVIDGEVKSAWISLDGISFAMQATKTFSVALNDGFQNVGSGFQEASYFKDGSLCVLTGRIQPQGGDVANFKSDLATLSEDCRPEGTLQFTAAVSGGQSARVNVGADGKVTWVAGAKGKFISLDGIAILTADARALTLATGWKPNGSPFMAPSYAKVNEACYLAGSVFGTAEKQPVVVLPGECRPASGYIIFHVARENGAVRINVSPDGSVVWANAPKGNTMLPLDGIHFNVAPAQEWEEDAMVDADKTRMERIHRLKAEEERAKVNALEESNKKFKRDAIPTPVPLESLYEEYGRTFQLPQYAKSGNVCFLSGTAATDNNDKIPGSTITMLSGDCQPAATIAFDMHTAKNAFVRTEVSEAGRVTWAAGETGPRIALNGMTYPSKTATLKPLDLQEPWVKPSAALQQPSYYIEGDFCILTGTVALKGDQLTSWSNAIAVLPTECRPDGRIIFNVASGAHTHRVDVYPEGKVIWVSGDKKVPSISLDGIAFFKASTEALVMKNGWRRFAGSFHGPTYRLQKNLCALSGVVEGLVERNITVLPADCRPHFRQTFSVNVGGTGVGRIDIYPNGDVRLEEGPIGEDKFASLDSIHFLVSDDVQKWEVTRAEQIATRQKETAAALDRLKAAEAARRLALSMPAELPLANSFVEHGHGFRLPQLARHGHVCVLSGMVSTTNMKAVLANLPAHCVPLVKSASTLYRLNGDSVEDSKMSLEAARYDIDGEGKFKWVSGGKPSDANLVSLDGVSFAVNTTKPDDLSDVSLSKPWTAAGTDYGSKVQVAIDSGLCALSGSVTIPSSADPSKSGEIGMIDSQCRPDKTLSFNVPLSTGFAVQSSRVHINADGKIVWADAAADWAQEQSERSISLSGIAYYLRPQHDLELGEVSKVTGGEFRGPSWNRYEKLCSLSGSITVTPVRKMTYQRSFVVAKLPAACRPASGMVSFVLEADSFHADGTKRNHERVQISRDGKVTIFTESTSAIRLSLDGVQLMVNDEQSWEVDGVKEVVARQKREAEAALAAFEALSSPSAISLENRHEYFGEGTRVPQFARYGQICILSGTARFDSVTAGTVRGAFGKSCWPMANAHFALHDFETHKVVGTDVLATGKIQHSGGFGAGPELSLSGVAFPVTGTRKVYPIKLSSNLQSTGGDFGEVVAVRERDICVFSGQVNATTSGAFKNGTIGEIPEVCRPEASRGGLTFIASNGDKNTVRLTVTADGNLNLETTSSFDESLGLSLNSVIYYTKSTQAVAVVNGAKIVSESPASWKKDGSLCVFSGSIQGGGETHVATTDKSCRPNDVLSFTLSSSLHAAERVDIHPDGSIQWVGGENRQDTLSLDGLYFMTASEQEFELTTKKDLADRLAAAEEARAGKMKELAAPRQITLAEKIDHFGWGYRYPQTSRYGSICFASGHVSVSSLQGDVARFSDNCHPKHRSVFDMHSAKTKTVRLDVVAAGNVKYVAGSQDGGWLSFDGISYPVKDASSKDIALDSNWKSAGSEYGVPPTYTKEGDYCAINGFVEVIDKDKWKSGSIIAILPETCRPKEGRIVFNANHQEITHRIDVTVDGEIVWYAGDKKYDTISLSSIGFFTTTTKSAPLTPSWAAYGEGFRKPSYRREDSLCALTGAVRGDGNKHVLTLPKECHPPAQLLFAVNHDLVTETLVVMHDGRVLWEQQTKEGDDKATWLSLDGVRFMVPQSPDWEIKIEEALLKKKQAEEKVKEEATKKKDEENKKKADEEAQKAKVAEEKEKVEEAKKEEAEKVEAKKQEQAKKQAAEEAAKDAHRLALADGNEAYGYGYTVPQWKAIGEKKEICVLQGVGHSKNLHGTWATLPEGCRPANTLDFDMPGPHTEEQRITVNTKGQIAFKSSLGKITSGWFSVGGMVFPTDAAEPKDLDLKAPWVNFGKDNFGDATYVKVGELCVLSGMVRISNNNWGSRGSHVLTIPAECRPTDGVIFTSISHGNRLMRADIGTDGRLVFHATWDSSPFLSLNGIAFMTESSSQPLTLENNWSAYGGAYRKPSYFRQDKLCVLSGLARGSARGPVAAVPSECRPPKKLIFHTIQHPEVQRIDVYPDGRVVWVDGVNRHGYVSLDGIRYVVGQRVLSHASPADKPLAKVDVKLNEAWKDFGGEFRGITVTRMGSLCMLSGLLKSDDIQSELMVLPEDCRPEGGRLVFNSVIKGMANARIDVDQDGITKWAGGSSKGTYMSLDGIKFGVVGTRASAVKLDGNYVPYGRGYAEPSFFLQGDLCTLTGMAKRADNNNMPASGHYLFYLPPECRPTDGHVIFPVNHHQYHLSLTIHQDGSTYMSSWNGIAHPWFSLSGISFFTSSGQNKLKLQPNWWAHLHGWRAPSYRLNGQICVLSGLVTGNGNSRRHVTTLPVGCRPNKRLIFYTSEWQWLTRMDVLPDGRVFHVDGHRGHNHMVLDGISFFADKAPEPAAANSKWTKGSLTALSLMNGFRNMENFAPLSYYKSGDICYVGGVMRSNEWRQAFARLPEECRPEGRMAFTSSYGSVGQDVIRSDVLADGLIKWHAGAGKGDYYPVSMVFPVKGVQSAPLSLEYMFVDYGDGYAHAKYVKQGNVCVLQGLLRTDNYHQNEFVGTFAIIPHECQPRDGHLLFVGGSNEYGQDFLVNSHSGRYYYSGGNTQHAFVSLGGIAYPVHPGTNSLSFNSHWSAYGYGYRRPQWVKEGHMCFLTGFAHLHSTQPHLTTLPGACRPTQDMFFTQRSWDGARQFRVFSNGDVKYLGSHTRSWNWVSLDGIYFVTDSWEEPHYQEDTNAESTEGTALNLTAGVKPFYEGFRNPLYTKVGDDLCVLSGKITSHDIRQTYGTVGDECKPRARYVFNVFNGINYPRAVRVDVRTSGEVSYVTEDEYHDHGQWIDLDGIMYPTKSAEMYPLFLHGELVEAGGEFAPPQYGKFSGDVCIFSGSIRWKNNGYIGSGTTLFVAPEECRPNERLTIVSQIGHTWSTIRIETNGQAQLIHQGASNSARSRIMSIDGISFVPQKGKLLEMIHGWSHYGNGYRLPQYHKTEQHLCILSGLARGSNMGVITILPVECRPHEKLTFGTTNWNYATRIDIHPDGRVISVHANQHNHITLEGIQFVVPTNPGTSTNPIIKFDGKPEFTALQLGDGISKYHADYLAPRSTRWGSLCLVEGVGRASNDARQSVYGTITDGDCRPDGRHSVMAVNDDASTYEMALKKSGTIEFVTGSKNSDLVAFSNFVYVGKGVNKASFRLSSEYEAFGHGYATPGWIRQNGYCVVEGMIKMTRMISQNEGSDKFREIGYLPADCRPRDGVIQTVVPHHEGWQQYDIHTDGRIYRNSWSHVKDSFVSLTGIHFWPGQLENQLSIQSGWGNRNGGYRQGGWQSSGAMCALGGVLSGNGNTFVAKLPDECRPSASVVFNTGYPCPQRIVVTKDGIVNRVSGCRSWGHLSLENIAFVRGTSS